jgi:hypothetical protein
MLSCGTFNDPQVISSKIHQNFDKSRKIDKIDILIFNHISTKLVRSGLSGHIKYKNVFFWILQNDNDIGRFHLSSHLLNILVEKK